MGSIIKEETMIPLRIKAIVIPIPEGIGIEFREFCKSRGIIYLSGGRRGWSSRLNTYIRGSTYIVDFPDFGASFFATQDEIDEMRKPFRHEMPC